MTQTSSALCSLPPRLYSNSGWKGLLEVSSPTCCSEQVKLDQVAQSLAESSLESPRMNKAPLPPGVCSTDVQPQVWAQSSSCFQLGTEFCRKYMWGKKWWKMVAVEQHIYLRLLPCWGASYTELHQSGRMGVYLIIRALLFCINLRIYGLERMAVACLLGGSSRSEGCLSIGPCCPSERRGTWTPHDLGT